MSDVLLPPNATTAELAMEGATARVIDTPVPIRDLWDADTAPDSLLPWLAWAYSVDEWDAGWTNDQRRAAIRRSVEIHRHKGTIGAVRNALAALGFGVEIQEWFNQVPEAAPYTFGLILTTNQVGINQAAIAKILQVIDSTKNLRSHLNKVSPIVVTRSEVYMAGFPMLGSEITISAGVAEELPVYSDGTVAYDLIADSDTYGVTSTTGAMDKLDNVMREQMPANEWKA